MALRGIKVLEFAGLAPVPFCGMVLSDFGASVTKIERIQSGAEDLDTLSNGKNSVSLNLKHPEAVKIVKALVKGTDVLIEPFRKGVMEKLGLGPKEMLEVNPQLIYARLTGYGQHGKYSSNAGHDINYLGLSGLQLLFGRYGAKPTFPANFAADFGGGGLTCAFGILAALIERNNSNKGQIIDSSMVEGTSYLGSWIFRSLKLEPVWGRERGKNFLDSGAHFYDVYETKDGKYLSVGALEVQFYQNLLQGLGLSEDEVPQFFDFEKGKETFEKVFKTKTLKEWCEIFDSLDACVAPVLSPQEAPFNEHNKERGSFVENSEEIVPNPAPKLSRTPAVTSYTKPSPRKGQHTKSLLLELGYNDVAIKKLHEDGAIFCELGAKL